jgi:hypothetical protein
MWSDAYESFSNYEKGEFRRLCNYLLSHTYIVRDQYRPDKQWTEPNSDYRMVNRLFECIREYFYVSGWRLEKDDNYGVISLINEFDHNRMRMNRFSTLFLYTCRLIYEEGREQGGNQNVVRTDTAAIVEKMRLLGVLDRGKSSKTERLEAQRTLAHFNIIQKMDSAAWNPDGNNVLILPSILSIISAQSINDMISEIEELRTEEHAPRDSDESMDYWEPELTEVTEENEEFEEVGELSADEEGESE